MRRRRLLALSLCVASVAVAAAGRAQQAAAGVVGHAVVATGTCCGGMARRPEDVCETLSPFVGELTIRSGRANRGRVVARVTTDAGGRFHAALPPGTYCVVGPDKAGGAGGSGGMRAAAPSGGNVNAACMAEYQRTCDAIATVPGTRVTARIERPCFGVCYAGPMPG